MDEKRKRPGTGITVVGVIVLLIVAYPLLLGPIVWLDNHYGFPEFFRPVVEAIYVPIGLLMQESDTFKNIVNWYLELWV